MSEQSDSVLLCVEDELYKRYLEKEMVGAQLAYAAVDTDELTHTFAENPSGLLVVQSDTREHYVMEVSSKLKRLFGDEIRVMLLSSDYETAAEAGTSIDVVLQYPVPFSAIRDAMSQLNRYAKKILVIDDSKLVHKHLVPPLGEAGYDVYEAFDGEEGLVKAKAVKPDLVICDVEMPKMNGFEVCGQLRQLKETADTYLIICSTLGSAADQQKGFRAGVDEYITKPVVIAELLDRIERVFKSTHTGRERILVLENNDQLGRNISKSLAKQGFSARVTLTLKETLRNLKRTSYDLLIAETDISDGNVIDLFEAVKLLPSDRHPDVIILTKREGEADAKMARNAGAVGILSQPFTMDSLSVSVERALADRRARTERSQIEKYMSKASMRMALEKSILSGTRADARAFKRNATIYFSDIASFTHRCEKYLPREIVAQVNAHFEVLTRVIIKHGGDIDKFIGDACMAFWLDDDPVVSARRAIDTVLDIQRELSVMNTQNPVLVEDPIRVRVGVNTGEVILCDLGAAEARIDLTIIGDAVNVAARLESAGKQYGVDNLISEDTIRPLMDEYAVRVIDWVRVVGKTKPVGCYELFGRKRAVTAEEEQLILAFEAAMQAYKLGDFQEALELFAGCEPLEKARLEGLSERNPSRLYQQRCRQLIDHPPQDWDGVWTLTWK